MMTMQHDSKHADGMKEALRRAVLGHGAAAHARQRGDRAVESADGEEEACPPPRGRCGHVDVEVVGGLIFDGSK